jgi:ribosomal protein S18 acetylase RimI-like enzyme
MSVGLNHRIAEPRIQRFDKLYAPVVARWVTSDDELRWLAPSSTPPLTAAKVAAWQEPDGCGFLLFGSRAAEPVGYGELKPMPREPDHYWLGHVVVDPQVRGQGIGRQLVRELTAYAFRNLGVQRLSLVVFPDNLVAVRCYRRAGFQRISEEYHRFGKTETEYKLVRLEMDKRRAARILAEATDG